jgi:hypothetical protein
VEGEFLLGEHALDRVFADRVGVGVDAHVLRRLDVLDLETAAHADHQLLSAADQPVDLEVAVGHQADLVVDGTKLDLGVLRVEVHLVQGGKVQVLPDAAIAQPQVLIKVFEGGLVLHAFVAGVCEVGLSEDEDVVDVDSILYIPFHGTNFLFVALSMDFVKNVLQLQIDRVGAIFDKRRIGGE